MDSKTVMGITIIGLTIGCIYLKVKNELLKESTSEEKVNLFNISLELAQDVIKLEKKIKELETK